MADGAGESEACRCWTRANRGSRALLGSILGGWVSDYHKYPDEKLVASEVSERDGFDLKKVESDLHTIPQGIDPGKGKDSTLNHRWQPKSVERVLTFGYNTRVWKVVVSGQAARSRASPRPTSPSHSSNAYANLMADRPMVTLTRGGKPRLPSIYWVLISPTTRRSNTPPAISDRGGRGSAHFTLRTITCPSGTRSFQRIPR